jgi:hypothetical protein
MTLKAYAEGYDKVHYAEYRYAENAGTEGPI